LPERFSVCVPPVANDICRSAVTAPKYLPERRSTAFPHHYTPVSYLCHWWPQCIVLNAVRTAMFAFFDENAKSFYGWISMKLG